MSFCMHAKLCIMDSSQSSTHLHMEEEEDEEKEWGILRTWVQIAFTTEKGARLAAICSSQQEDYKIIEWVNVASFLQVNELYKVVIIIIFDMISNIATYLTHMLFLCSECSGFGLQWSSLFSFSSFLFWRLLDKHGSMFMKLFWQWQERDE